MNRSAAIELLQKYIKEELISVPWFKQIQAETKAIIFYGSRAKEANREDSDFDILIIMPLEIERKYTKGEYFVNYKERQINIVIRSIERLRVISAERSDVFQAKVVSGSEILWSKDNEVASLIEGIKAIKKEP